jgi:hypothetical protein
MSKEKARAGRILRVLVSWPSSTTNVNLFPQHWFVRMIGQVKIEAADTLLNEAGLASWGRGAEGV